MDSDGPSWYAVHTRSRAEKSVRDQLLNQHIETFLPLVTRVSEWKGRRKRVEHALFPGYCFAKLPAQYGGPESFWPDVAPLLSGIDGAPQAVPDADVLVIRRIVESHRPYTPYPGRADGLLVEVVRGPLTGIQGMLVRPAHGCRIVVSCTGVGQGLAVEVDPLDVSPIDQLIHH